MQKKNGRKIIGYIDYIDKWTVGGWAMRTDANNSIWVELWINDQKIGRRIAKIPRADIKEKFLNQEDCGFRFHKRGLLKRGDKIEIKAGRVGINIPFATSTIVQRKNLPKRRNKEALIPTDSGFYFIHVPKTAGTSFRVMLYDLFSPSEIIPNVYDIEKNSGGYPEMTQLLSQKSVDDLKMIRLLAGHYPYQPMKYFLHQPKAIVFLRDPLERAVSNLFHLKKRQPQFFNSTFEEVFEESPRQILNMQVRYLSGRIRKKEMKLKDLRVAIQKLRSIECIGLTEQFDASIDYVEKKFDWKFPERLARNVNTTNTLNELDPDLLNRIREGNYLDQRLYDMGVKLFVKQTRE